MDLPKIFAIDFEGNGREGILEIGAICLADGELRDPVGNFCSRSREPGIFLSRRKIPLGRTADGLPLDDFLGRLRAMRCAGILAAHHAPTEDALLRRHCPSPGLVPDWTSPGQSVGGWGPWLDSRLAAKKIWPRLGSYGLGKILRWLGMADRWRELGSQLCPADRRAPHCALYDAIGCALVLDCCLRETGIGPVDLLQLVAGERQRQFLGIL
ncbi:MAG: hypothetical protein LBB14_02750 [Puniceicoccales bacterium]|nr:hypothetical protein [Puniceicoccales bacterium]